MVVLERVAAGQGRFVTPGLVADERGIALGRRGAFLFAGIDGVVGWLRLLADEVSLDELIAGLELARVETASGASVFLVRVPVPSSRMMDTAARLARLLGAGAFTGTDRHHVRWRDDKAPQGWDVSELAGDARGEHVLYDHGGAIALTVRGRLEPRALLTGLALRRVPGGTQLDAAARSRLWLAAPPGLGRGLLTYLARAGVSARVAEVIPEDDGAVFATRTARLLFELIDLPERLLASLRPVPGVTIYKPVLAHVGVEVGWEHPVNLAACGALFDAQRQHLLAGSGAHLALAAPVQFVDAARLAELPSPTATHAPAPEARAHSRPPDAFGLPLRLVGSTTRRRIGATLVPLADAARLRQLVYLLPPAVLAAQRIAHTPRGFLVVAASGADVIPLGALLAELAPGLYLPAGLDVVPRLPLATLADAVGHAPGRVSVLADDGPPLAVLDSAFVALDRASVRVPAAEVVGAAPAADPVEPPPEVENQPIGTFALWGLPAPDAG